MDKPTPEDLQLKERRRQRVRIAAFVLFLLVLGAAGSALVEVSWKDHLINWQTSSQTEEIPHMRSGG